LLLEQAGEAIAEVIMGEFKAPWVKVSIAKLGALRNVKRLGVTIERGRQP
jgi:dihydroneopterin aldolase